METLIINKRKELLFSEKFMKTYLRLPDNESSQTLFHLLDVAMDWVEDQLNKTFLKKTIKVSHRNHRFTLPYGPILKVLEVFVKEKKIPETGYTLTPTIAGESIIITLPFQWKSPEISVVYEAGYGMKKSDVPSVFQHAVLEILSLLYEHRGEVAILQDYTAPWLQTHKLYHLG